MTPRGRRCADARRRARARPLEARALAGLRGRGPGGGVGPLEPEPLILRGGGTGEVGAPRRSHSTTGPGNAPQLTVRAGGGRGRGGRRGDDQRPAGQLPRHAPATDLCASRASGQRADRVELQRSIDERHHGAGEPLRDRADRPRRDGRPGPRRISLADRRPSRVVDRTAPLTSVNIVAPTAQRSVRPSTSAHFPSACSGARNAGAPRTPRDRAASSTRPIPKSSARSPPARSKNRFSGLMSRWTTPFACAAPEHVEQRPRQGEHLRQARGRPRHARDAPRTLSPSEELGEEERLPLARDTSP